MIGKKILLVLILISGLLLFSSCKTNDGNNLKKLDFDGRTIYLNAKEYTVSPVLEAKESIFDKKVGVIDNNLIVYSLKGYSSDQWLTIKDEGLITLYKEKNVKDIDIRNFNTTEIEIMNPIGMYKLNTVKDTEIIKSLHDKIINGSPLKVPNQIKDSKILFLSSNLYPGLIYVLTYVIDKDGKKLIYNNLQENAYEVGDLLSSYLK